MGKIICPSCEEELDMVVLGYGTRSWDEETQSYIHTEKDDEGDWQCPKCGATVSEVRFYPPTAGRPFPQTYDDWVSLGMSVKEKAGIDDFKTTALVNENLEFIATDDPIHSEEAKRWLTQKAGELGVK